MGTENEKTKLEEALNTVLSSPKADISLYLKLINAPVFGHSIFTVNERFLELFPIIKKIDQLECVQEFLDEDTLSKCWVVAENIKQNKDAILHAFPNSRFNQTNLSHEFRGIHGDNPTYVCIGVSANNNKNMRHLLLEAYLVIASYVLRIKLRRRPQDKIAIRYDNAIEEGCLTARQLSLAPRADTLANLPDQLMSEQGDFLKCIENGGKPLRKIFVLLDDAFNQQIAPTRSGTRGARDVHPIHHPINDAVDPELIGRVDKVGMIQPKTRRANPYLDPQESTSGAEYLDTEAPGPDPRAGRTSEQEEKNRRGYQESIAMHNQRLLYRWEILTLHEVSLFLETMQLIAEGRHTLHASLRANYDIDPLEVCAVAITIFLRSSPLDENGLSQIRLNDGAYNQIIPPGYRFYGDKIGCWIAKAPTLGVTTRLPFPNLYANAERKREFFYISSGTGLEKIIDDYIIRVRGNSETNKKLFLHKLKDYKKAINSVLSDINKQHKTRLTIKRIEWYLHNLLSRQRDGDITTAMLLTGKDDFLGSSPLHYTAVPVSSLQKLYHTCCSEIIDKHLKEMAVRCPETLPSPLQASPILHAWGGTTGTAFRPRRSAVGKMIRRLRERLDFVKGSPRSLEKLIRLHNNIVRYTAVMFAFSTGFRAITSPLLPPSQIDDATGFAVISDKDSGDYYNARIVWLPPVCIKQYRLYLEHLDAFFPKLEFLDLEAFNALKTLLEEPRPSDRLPLFFLLTYTGTSSKITPTDLWKEIRQKLQYDLPANASRHYLRSILLERGCPPELVAAYMGHWERGEEPWGRYSALSPNNYALTLGRYLIPLLEEDGWKPMSGMKRHW